MIEPTLKRLVPTADELRWRASYLRTLAALTPLPSEDSRPSGLALGNSKTGSTGTKYRTVFVWNIPSVATCPGATAWCLDCCYNADPRAEKFPLREWQINWWWVTVHPEVLYDRISTQLREGSTPCAVRIHSSGDFYNNRYIQFWYDLATAFPAVLFWGYTRSWSVRELLPQLVAFRDLRNVQLFASWDSSMSEPDPRWRRAIVMKESSPRELLSCHDPKRSQEFCPEQFLQADNCASCGNCIEPKNYDVLFVIH